MTTPNDRGEGWSRIATFGGQETNLPFAYRTAAYERARGYRAKVVQHEGRIEVWRKSGVSEGGSREHDGPA